MSDRKRSFRATRRTPEEVAADRAVRETLRDHPDYDELVARGDIDPAETTTLGEYLAVRQALAALKRERIRKGLSLTDVAERSGLDRAAISKLENGHQLNPTLATLARYAAGVGKRLRLVIADPDAPAPAGAGTTTGEG